MHHLLVWAVGWATCGRGDYGGWGPGGGYPPAAGAGGSLAGLGGKPGNPWGMDTASGGAEEGRKQPGHF